MKTKYIDNETAKNWQDVAQQWKKANCILLDIRLALIKDMGVAGGPALDAINKAIRETAMSYEFTPQSEWMGGNSLDPDNFRYREPHIMEGGEA